MAVRALIVALAVIGGLALFFHQPIAEWLMRAPSRPQATVATLAQVQGGVDVRAYQTNAFESELAVPRDLHLGDTLRTNLAASARLNFKSGHSLELQSETQLTFEKQINGDALVLNLVRGEITVLQDGSPGQLLILEKGFLREPGGRMPKEPLRIQAADVKANTEVTPIGAEPMAQPSADDKDATGSLSTDYIVSVIQGQKAFFNRCYATHLQKDPYAKGTMNFAFTITQSGQVKDVKLLGATITDATLQKCVTAVMERLRFRAFEAKPIIANYPIVFE